MQREAYFDNAKLLFIFLVVFGHLIQPLKGNLVSADVLYQWIYIFHIPGFVLISGFFASGARDHSHLSKLLKRLLIPFVIFQVFYTISYTLAGNGDWYIGFYEPQWSLWFLVSLFSWHILLIWFKKLPPLAGIAIAFCVGLLIGVIPFIGHGLSLSRTFVFFPFFLMGYWLSKGQLFQLQYAKYKIMAVSILVTSFVISYFYPMIPSELLFGSYSYQAIELQSIGILSRFGLYALALLMVFSVLALVPQRRFTFTHLGQYTLYVYLLHGIIIQATRQAELFQLNESLDIIALACVAGAIVWLLTSNWVMTVTQPLVEWKTTRLQQWIEDRKQKDSIYQNKSYKNG
ncbi:acyltransferase family protein [Aquisalibacillus elongatus]|uniref:Fucose 4-O-acetylase-like acetyltransferase n=1 Tax=Aquisalibacillus elongatus TaxID=485577 RepID=A0A3N5B7Z0_9BACI|nr:acyltransferase family protein [Aquisalibacillus elongatus]RPF53453.1 fucose 4-O-acetylase-like acetyltransferase [Aquisalibacillus elongatus]